jgi:2-haloacid dehalogenase
VAGFSAAGLGAVAVGVSSRHTAALQGARVTAHLTNVKALVFDVFGTVVDWRTSVAQHVEALARQKGVRIDGAAFADAWRAQYAPSMNRVRSGELPWTTLDQLHRMVLDRLIPEFGLKGLSEAETVSLNKAWHRLHPWPDSVPGLTRLKRKFIIAPLSNGNIALMTDMAKFAGLPWDCILGAELARHYKPDPEVYQSAARFLDLEPGEILMVAAHLNDLRAAKSQGLQTAFVARPNEYGPNPSRTTPDLVADDAADISAKDFVHLATQLNS